MKNKHTAFDPTDRRVLERSGIASTLAANPEMRFDGEEDASLYFARELDYVKAKTYDRVYPELTALQMLALLKESGKKASEVFGSCPRYPQVLINVPVADKAKKEAVLSAPALQSAVAEQEEKLAGNGRVLVRPSGTEALIRVMVEAQTEPVARETAELLANVIKNHGS